MYLLTPKDALLLMQILTGCDQIANTQIYAFLNSPIILQLLSCCPADITIMIMLQILSCTVQYSVHTLGQKDKVTREDQQMKVVLL